MVEKIANLCEGVGYPGGEDAWVLVLEKQLDYWQYSNCVWWINHRTGRRRQSGSPK